MESSRPPTSSRIAREKQTVQAMIALYCRAHHGPRAPVCEECNTMLDYALCRLDRCPFGAEKPPCAKCPVHCYKPAMRARIQEVMRYSGPRMLLRHPILAMLHVWDGFRK